MERTDMDHHELRRRLSDLGVRPDAYQIMGTAENAYCLIHQGQDWIVFHQERGLRLGERRFQAEDEACAYFLSELSRDPTIREDWRG